MRIILLSLALLMIINVQANTPFKRINVPLKKEDYKNHKCVNYTTKIREKITYDEACDYSVKGCPKEKTDKKITMYCLEKNLSSCFTNKTWITENELVGLPEDIDIGLITQGLSVKKGAMTGKTCAYYNPK